MPKISPSKISKMTGDDKEASICIVMSIKFGDKRNGGIAIGHILNQGRVCFMSFRSNAPPLTK